MAESRSEALSREIFLHTQSTADMYYRLDTLVKPFSCVVEEPFDRLIFIRLAPLMKQIKRSRSRLL